MRRELVHHLRELHPALDVKGRWAFFGNPKTAQKAMGWVVLRYSAVHYYRGHRNWHRVWDHWFADRLDEVFGFTFVRNPWDRVVSAFSFLQQRGEIEPEWTFPRYVQEVLAPKGVAVNVHFREQSLTVLFRGSLIPGMFVGRFEHLERDWAYVAGRIGADRQLPHSNASRHGPYSTYYDDKTREIISQLYAEEIKALGYEFGN